MKYNLRELKQITTRYCRLASDARHTFQNAAVNWADFQCVCAEYFIDDCGDIGYRVYIEEANPDNSEVISFIHDELIMHGYRGIEIRMDMYGHKRRKGKEFEFKEIKNGMLIKICK